MQKQWNQIVEFYDRFKINYPSSPKFLEDPRKTEQVDNLFEEVKEFRDAENLEGQARELCDILYFALGALVEIGVQPDQIFDLIHKANMEKVPVMGQRKFATKPEGWESPQKKIDATIDALITLKQTSTIQSGTKDPSVRRSDLLTVGKALLNSIAPDPNHEGVKDTPRRFADAWLELTSGYHVDVSKLLSVSFSEEEVNQMVLLQGIKFYSTCEHHLLPFHGTAHVAYIPKDNKVVGLSKLARLVDAYARRLQIQERMTNQIASALEEHANPMGVAVTIEAVHTCACMRGIRAAEPNFVTSSLKGVFLKEPEVRTEYFSLIKGK